MFEVGKLVARVVLEGAQAFRSDLARLRAEWDGLGKTGTDAAADIGSAGLKVGLAITGIGALVVKAGTDYNSLQQRTRAALETILGSAAAANEQMDKLDAFARTSPFAKQVFIQAQQQMLAFGIETKKVIPYLSAVQDAIAAAGGSNEQLLGVVATMSKIQASSKITAEDLNEFGNRGINAAELIGSQMGKTGEQIREEITAGTLGAEEALDALVAGMGEKFGGAASNLKETWDGAMDRLKAAWRDFAADVTAPLVSPEGGGILTGLVNFTADALRGFTALPGPIKTTTAAFVGLVGIVALVGGAFLVSLPHILEMKAAFAALSTEMPRTAAVLKALHGPIGTGLAAAAAVGIAALLMYMSKQREIQALADEVQASLEKSTGALTTTSRELIAAKLAEAGAFEAAANEGWKARDVLDAVIEGGDKLARLEEDLTARNNFVDFFNGSGVAAGNAGSAIRDLREGIERAGRQFDDESAAVGENTLLVDENAASASAASEAYRAAAAEVSLLTDEVHTLNAAVMEGNEVGQSAIAANVAYQEQLAQVQEQIALVQAGTEGYAASLDVNTEAGRQNVAMLLEEADKAIQVADAQLKVDGDTARYNETLRVGRDQLLANALALSGDEAAARALADQVFNLTGTTADLSRGVDLNTEAGKRQRDTLVEQGVRAIETANKIFELDGNVEGLSSRLATGRERLIASAQQMGWTAGQAQDLANRIYGIPTSRYVNVTVNTWDARASLDALLAAYQNRTISLRAYIHAVEGQSEGGIRFYREGGIEHYARGGRHGLREQHVAQLARAGVTRIWNEPETEGELYIPLAMRKRARSTAYLGTVANMFGYDLVKRGTSPVMPSTTKVGPDSGTQHVTEVIELQVDGRTLSRVIREYERSIS